MDWIDVPVLKAMEYFSGVMAWFLKFGSLFATTIGLLGIFWAGFKVLNARVGARQAFWDILYKWLLFTIMINLYIPASHLVGKLGNQIGTEAGNGKQTIVDALNSIKQSLEADLNTQRDAAANLNASLAGTRIKELHIDMDFSHYDSYSQYVNTLSGALENSSIVGSSKTDNRQKLDKARYDPAFTLASDRATLNSIKKVLVERKMDGTDGGSLISSYIDLDIFLKDKDGNDSPYFSPSALCRLVMLTAQIMRAKLEEEWAMADRDWNTQQDAANANLGWVMNTGEKIGNRIESLLYPIIMWMKRILPSLLCFAAQLMLIFTSIFCSINYVMMVLEYIIVMGIGAFFLPFILFDGTKDMAKKLVPVFTGFLIKFIVIDIIMFFVYWLYIDQCVNTIGDSGGMNITTFATVAFNAIVALVLTRQAPKIADTLLTGRPSLDFGELRQTMHDARAAAHDLKTVGKAGVGVTRAGVNGTINTVGRMHKAHEAGREAADIYKASHQGQGKVGQFFGSQLAKHGAKNAVYRGEALESLKAKGEQFLHGGKGGSGSGYGGGSGNAAYMRSGQAHNQTDTANNTLNGYSNPKFQNASMYDKQSDTHRNMKLGEFMGEKGSQGRSAGAEWAAKHGLKRPEHEQNPDDKEAANEEKKAENQNPSTQAPATDAEQAGTTGEHRMADGVPDSQQNSDNKDINTDTQGGSGQGD